MIWSIEAYKTFEIRLLKNKVLANILRFGLRRHPSTVVRIAKYVTFQKFHYIRFSIYVLVTEYSLEYSVTSIYSISYRILTRGPLLSSIYSISYRILTRGPLLSRIYSISYRILTRGPLLSLLVFSLAASPAFRTLLNSIL